MKSSRLFLILTFFALLFFEVGKPFAQNNVVPTVDMEKLFVTTDRYFYKPGERILFSVRLLDENNRQLKEMSVVNVRLEQPNGQVVDSVSFRVLGGLYSAYVMLPQVGGVYKLTARTNYQNNAREPKIFSKDIYVQEYIEKSFFIEQKLSKNAFKPGDEVISDIHVSQPGGKDIEGLEVSCVLMVNGEPVSTQHGVTGVNGNLKRSFILPGKDIQDAYVTAYASYQGETEKDNHRITILRRDVNLQTFLGSGSNYLVAGLSNKVVVRSFDSHGNPRDISGYIKDNQGNIVTRFSSLHGGLAAVNITPQAGKRYTVHCPQAEKEVELPEVRSSGCVLEISETGKEFSAMLKGNRQTAMSIRIVGAGKVLGAVQVPAGNQPFKHNMSKGTLNSGIVGIVLMDSTNKVIARRLVMNLPAKHKFDINYDPEQVVPGQSLNIRYKSADNEQANFTMRIIDEQSLKQIKDRSHSIESWIYMGCELNGVIDEPKFYFNRDQRAAQSLDMLMIASKDLWRRSYLNGALKAIDGPLHQRVKAGISGVVRGNSYLQVVKGVRVTIANTSYSTVTDSVGYFEFLNLPGEVVSGEVKLFLKKGFERVEAPVHESQIWFDYGSGKPKGRLHYYFGHYGLYGLRSYNRKLPDIVYNTVPMPARNLSFNGDRTAATAQFVDGVRVTNAESLACMTIMRYVPPDFGYNEYFFFGEDEIGYQQPFYVTLYNYGYQRNQRNINYMNSGNQGTLVWWGDVQTDEEGEVEHFVTMPAQNGGYVIFCDGVTESGKLISASKPLLVKDAIESQAKVPQVLTYGDKALIRVKFVNQSNANKEVVYGTSINGIKKEDTLMLASGEVRFVPVILDIKFDQKNLQFAYYYQFDGLTRWSDVHSIQLVRRGELKTEAGSAYGNKIVTFDVNKLISESANFSFSAITDFQEVIKDVSERMIRQPHGCFEQVSSANYPNLLALKILRSSGRTDNTKVEDFIRNGYGKLVAYETPSKGFEWYGKNPPHTSLTAYGLLQFYLMKELDMKVDEVMFDRNLKWLLDQRDGQGGYRHVNGRYGFSGVHSDIQDAYITWVLSRITTLDLSLEITRIEQSMRTFDAYKAALLANIYANRGKYDKAKKTLEELNDHIETHVQRALKSAGSVMHSGGKSLDNQILALTLICMQHVPDYPEEKSMALMRTLMGNRTNYGFGATQANALCLEALSYYGDYFREIGKQQSYTVRLNGKDIMTYETELFKGKKFKIDLDDTKLLAGKNTLEVICGSETPAPFVYDLAWHEDGDGEQHNELGFDFTLSATDATVSDLVFANVAITNKTKEVKPQTVAVISLPGGFSVSPEELRTMQKEAVFDYYEIWGNEIHLYFLNLDSMERKTLRLALTANVSGDYYTQESYVYQYYTPEIKSSVNLKMVSIKEEVSP